MPTDDTSTTTNVAPITGVSDFDSLLSKAKGGAKEAAFKKFKGEVESALGELIKAKATTRDTISTANATLAKATELYDAKVAKIQQDFKDYKDIAVD